jgi:hypothetical protein
MTQQRAKRSRWLLLKAAENLDSEHDEEEPFGRKALKLNKPLATASYPMEEP